MPNDPKDEKKSNAEIFAPTKLTSAQKKLVADENKVTLLLDRAKNTAEKGRKLEQSGMHKQAYEQFKEAAEIAKDATKIASKKWRKLAKYEFFKSEHKNRKLREKWELFLLETQFIQAINLADKSYEKDTAKATPFKTLERYESAEKLGWKWYKFANDPKDYHTIAENIMRITAKKWDSKFYCYPERGPSYVMEGLEDIKNQAAKLQVKNIKEYLPPILQQLHAEVEKRSRMSSISHAVVENKNRLFQPRHSLSSKASKNNNESKKISEKLLHK